MNSNSIVQRLRKYCHVLLADCELGASRAASLREYCVNQLRTVLHSAIQYVTPDARYFGQEHAVLARRRELYKRARAANPERWTGATRNWTPVGLATLNPERAPAYVSPPTARQQS